MISRPRSKFNFKNIPKIQRGTNALCTPLRTRPTMQLAFIVSEKHEPVIFRLKILKWCGSLRLITAVCASVAYPACCEILNGCSNLHSGNPETSSQDIYIGLTHCLIIPQPRSSLYRMLFNKIYNSHNLTIIFISLYIATITN